MTLDSKFTRLKIGCYSIRDFAREDWTMMCNTEYRANVNNHCMTGFTGDHDSQAYTYTYMNVPYNKCYNIACMVMVIWQGA